MGKNKGIILKQSNTKITGSVGDGRWMTSTHWRKTISKL